MSAIHLCCPDSTFVVTVARHIAATILWVVEDSLCSAVVVKEWVDQNWLRLRNLSPPQPGTLTAQSQDPVTSLNARTFSPSAVAPGQFTFVAFSPAPLSLHTK